MLKKIFLVSLTSLMFVMSTTSIYAQNNNSANTENQNVELSEETNQTNYENILGEWYGCPYGIDMRLTFSVNENGQKVYSRDKFNKNLIEYGTWNLENDKLILDEEKTCSMIFDYKENELSTIVNNVHYLFTKEEPRENEPEIKKDVKENDYFGKWAVVEIQTGKISTKPEHFYVDATELKIKKNKVDFYANGNILSRPLMQNDIKTTFEDNHLKFEIDLVGDKVCLSDCYLLEDGSMKVHFITCDKSDKDKENFDDFYSDENVKLNMIFKKVKK